MGTYLNHKLTFIFSEDESYWAQQLPDNSSGWYSDDDRSDTHDNYEGNTVHIKHPKAHPDYQSDYGARISKCGRVFQCDTGMYGSYNLRSWSIPKTLIAIVSQWDNTQCTDCFALKTVMAADVKDFDWFPGAHRDDYLGSRLENLRPQGEDIDEAQWSQESWGIWATMNQAAVMAQLPMDIELPLQLIPLEAADNSAPKEITPLYVPELVQKHDGVDGYTFVLTGKIEGMTRAEATQLIEQHGGTVVSSVRKGVDSLLVGEKPGSKVQEAEALGIQIDDVNEMMEELVNFKGN